MINRLLPINEIGKYGFQWGVGEKDALVQVSRAASIERGKRGVFKVIDVVTRRQSIAVYISPTGMIRVFKGGVEIG